MNPTVVVMYVVVSTQFCAITTETSSRLRPNHPQLSQQPPTLARTSTPARTRESHPPYPAHHPRCHCDPRQHSEYSRAGFPLNGGTGSTSPGPNLTSTSKSLSHDLLHKKNVVIPSGSTSHPSCLVPSTDRCRKRGPRGHRSVVLHPRMFVPWTWIVAHALDPLDVAGEPARTNVITREGRISCRQTTCSWPTRSGFSRTVLPCHEKMGVRKQRFVRVWKGRRAKLWQMGPRSRGGRGLQ